MRIHPGPRPDRMIILVNCISFVVRARTIETQKRYPANLLCGTQLIVLTYSIRLSVYEDSSEVYTTAQARPSAPRLLAYVSIASMPQIAIAAHSPVSRNRN